MEQLKQIQSIQLEKAYTFFMVPFYYDEGDWDVIHVTKLNKWQPIKENLYNKEDVLYPYIMDLFKQDTSSGKSRLLIYELATQDNGPTSDLFVDRILGKRSQVVIANNATERKNPRINTITLINEGNMAPHIFISPSARIGIMTFAIELVETRDMDSLKHINYHLQKRDEIGKYQCICLRPDKQEEVLDEYQEVLKIANLWDRKTCNQRETRSNIDFICWNIDDFVSCLLATMGRPKEGQCRLKYFSKDRIHTFTFCSLDDVDNQLSEATLTQELLRLSRCVIDKYQLPFSQLIQQGAMLKTYDNIFFSSTIEGTAMLCVAKKENKAFVSEIHNTFERQYLLIYILVLIQRYTLLSLEQRLSVIESAPRDSDEALWELINVICRIKTNCYYTDVSIYTHHSQFYHHCCRNLHIPETFREIDEKLNLLKLTTDRMIQKSLEKQRQLQEEEAVKHQEEIERIKAKEQVDEKKRLQDQDAAERRQNILNWIVAVLTIAQVVQATYEIIHNRCKPSMWISVGIGLIGIITLICLMKKDIIDFFKPTNK